jgi:D-3-phosphoglycerate dehydrogenase
VDESVEALILDLLEWLDASPRPYAEVMDAWRTSCPRLPVWEEANDRGLVERRRLPGSGELVAASPKGHSYLRENRTSISETLLNSG